MTATDTAPDLAALLPSWLIHLQAERKSAQTLMAYRISAELFIKWCDAQSVPAVVNRLTVNGWIAGMLGAGAQAATARTRQQAIRRFSAWLAEEEEIPRDELIGIKPPKLDDKIVPRLTEDECRALIAACTGKSFIDRRDEAIVRLMLETALRAGEAMALTVADVDVSRGLAMVQRGKGGKGRCVPFGPQTGRALDRYLRLRRAHPMADAPSFWLGGSSQTFSYAGLHKALRARADRAGLVGFHPHVLRHTGAQRWLSAGGTEGSLMAVAGWSRRDMLDRYTRASAGERAADEARALNLGDL